MERSLTDVQLFRFGLFEADPVHNALTRRGVRVKVHDQPFRVLILLLERPGEIVSRDDMRQKLWPEGTYVDFDGSLNVILKKLRAAIDDDSDNPRFIETVPRRGYRFIAPVTTVGVASLSNTPTSDEVTSAIPSAEETSATDVPAADSTAPSRSHSLLFAIAIAVLVAMAGILVSVRSKAKAPAPSSASSSRPVPMRRSVAVLGFHNTSAKPEDEWMATAFSEMLSTEMAAAEKLRLTSGEDVANLRLSAPWPGMGTLDPKTAARLGTSLNADLLVLGSYTTVGSAERGKLRLDVRMQDAKTGEVLTEIAELGGPADLFAMVSRAGSKLRERIGIPSVDVNGEAGVLASVPLDREAAKFYSRGLAKLRDYDFLAAKDLLEQAEKGDPKFPLVHLALATAWSRLGYEQKRKEESKKALQTSADLATGERLLVEGNYYESLPDHERAASSYGVLFQLYPDNVEYGLLLAGTQEAAGHTMQAASTIAQLRALPSPASDDPRIDLADVGASAKDDPAKLALIRRAMGKAQAQGKRLLYADARKQECTVLNYSQHPEEGPAACEEAYGIFLAAGNHLQAADTIRLLGDHEGSQGHFEQAIATYERALTILHGLGEHLKTGAVLNNMAINYANEGKLDRAEQLYTEAKKHFEEAGDQDLVSTTLVNIADIRFLRGDLPGAERQYLTGLRVDSSLDHPDPGYVLTRLADLSLAQGRVQAAHKYAQDAIDALKPKQGGYQYLTGAMETLGNVLKAEGNLSAARKEFEEILEIRQKVGEGELVAEAQVDIGSLDVDDGAPDKAEPLIRAGITEFEKEQAIPAAASAYTELSRAFLAMRKTKEAREAIEHANELNGSNSDPSLKLAAAIQSARVTFAEANGGTGSEAQRSLRSSIATAKKLGYVSLQYEAELALRESEIKANPSLGRVGLSQLASNSRSHGLEFVAQRAERAAGSVNTDLTAMKTTSAPSRRVNAPQ